MIDELTKKADDWFYEGRCEGQPGLVASEFDDHKKCEEVVDDPEFWCGPCCIRELIDKLKGENDELKLRAREFYLPEGEVIQAEEQAEELRRLRTLASEVDRLEEGKP